MAAPSGCSLPRSSEPARSSRSAAVVPGRRGDRRDRRPAEGQRAGLVHDHGADPVGGLERLAAADDDPRLGAPTGADHDRGRGGQAHRARAGDDQHADERGQGAGSGAARARPGTRRRTSARRPTMTIGTKTSAIRSASALDRRLGALGPPDELDDPRQGRVTADPRRAHDEGAGDVARRADDRVARARPPPGPARRSASSCRRRSRPRRRCRPPGPCRRAGRGGGRRPGRPRARRRGRRRPRPAGPWPG